MGARNVAAAYVKFAGKVPPLSMVILAYMALIARDADENPWYGQGYDGIANCALGRDLPITDTDRQAVKRAMRPLIELGAITADRRGNGRRKHGPKVARYRLNLAVLPRDGIRTVVTPTVVRKPSRGDPIRGTESVPQRSKYYLGDQLTTED